MEQPSETVWFRAFDAKSLGSAIRGARKEQNLTQGELAKMIQASRHTIIRLEQGESVSIETATAAIRALNRDVALIPRFSRLQVKT